MNTVITKASLTALDSLVKRIRSKPGSIWDKAQFGTLHSEDGHGVRLIPLNTFLSPSEGAELRGLDMHRQKLRSLPAPLA